MFNNLLLVTLKVRDYSESLVVDEKIILKLILGR
jgi:hypothetical protein